MPLFCLSDPCPVIATSDCVTYVGAYLPNLGISPNDTLTVALGKIEAANASSAEHPSGTTAERQALTVFPSIGEPYWDTDLMIPLYYITPNWHNSAGGITI